MRTRGWAFAALAAVLVVTCSVATPMAAEADVGSEPTSTQVSCPSAVVAGSVLNCAGSVTGTSTNTRPPDGSVLAFTFDRGGLADTQCVLDGGSCTVSVVPTSAAVGPLTVTATYPGGAGYEASSAATTVSVFQPTRLVAKPAIANLVLPTKVNLEMSARLTDATDGTPIPDETIYFWASNLAFCEAITDASGVATCSSTQEAADAALGYSARFNSSTNYRLNSSTTGPGVRI